MYVTTFYSFKGGVGRTMALVNTAVTLALRGRRVLVVDFDVEAPGLDTFDVLRPSDETPGVIDFVMQYLESGRSPDARDFIGESPAIGEQGGGLWIMPSGTHETYAANYKQIDWGDLYDRHDGYLLFEDLKAQWRKIVQPDYVLIDSRTGHTDTSGICTRQLPDSVVVFFFPNEQNLRGLTEVVGDIRAEAKGARKKEINLHFVMSNVPDLDDEDRILESKIEAFQDQLGFQREPIVVHRYDSLSLLNQVVFSKDRPRSRLTEEYREIVREISVRNWQDRDGALDYLRRGRRRWWRGIGEGESMRSREEMLNKIEKTHSDDGEILFHLSVLREANNQLEWTALLDQAIDSGYEQPEAYLKRARIRADDDQQGAIRDIQSVLSFKQSSPPIIRRAVGLLMRMESCVPENIVETPAVTSLDFEDRAWLAESLDRTRSELLFAVLLWEKTLESCDLLEDHRDYAQHALGLAYMGLGQCSDAAKMFLRNERRREISYLAAKDAFNYGMAIWGATGAVENEIFHRVIELDQPISEKVGSASDFQRMALSYWAVGDNGSALECIEQAQRSLSTERSGRMFSYWRYLYVGVSLFKKDLDAIRALIEDHAAPKPLFLTGVGEKVTAP